jgi:hypothetical protein
MFDFLEKFEEWDPELSIQLLKIPSLPNYSGFRKLIENAKSSWMEDFLERDGLAVLFDRLEKLSTGFSITNALFQSEVTYAIRAVVNSKIGLEYLLAHRQFTRQLFNGMFKIHMRRFWGYIVNASFIYLYYLSHGNKEYLGKKTCFGTLQCCLCLLYYWS